MDPHRRPVGGVAVREGGEVSRPEAAPESVRDLIEASMWRKHTYADALCEQLGIDPDMPVSELRQALACWERVKQADAMVYGDLGRLVCGDDWNQHLEPHMNAADGADTLLRWLSGGAS